MIPNEKIVLCWFAGCAAVGAAGAATFDGGGFAGGANSASYFF